jgi:hypothetical protein
MAWDNYCIRCGRTSDQVVREDAQAEMELFDCKLPTANLATFPTI